MNRKQLFPMIMLLVILCALCTAFPVPMAETSGTIYIRADGSIEGTASIVSNDNVTYVFDADINDSVVVQRSNIIIDGADYTLKGKRGQIGFYLVDDNVTVKNTNIEGFDYGFIIEFSSRNTIVGNNIVNNGFGIMLSSSSNNTITANNVTDNSDGIYLYLSSNNTIRTNNITDNICVVSNF